MKKTFLLLGILIYSLGFSQSYIGYLNDNYSGVHNVLKNPAELTDSRLEFDVNLVGISGYLSNDLINIDIGKITRESIEGISSYKNTEDFEKMGNLTTLKNNNIAANIDLLAPSFTFTFKKKHSVALFTRVRAFANINNLNTELLTSYFDAVKEAEENKDAEATKKILKGIDDLGSFNFGFNIWSEIGASYATEIINKKEHFIKAGLSLKYLTGNSTTRGAFKDVTLKPNIDEKKPENSTIITSGTAEYGYSLDSNENKASGFGVDLGATYEWRPKYRSKKDLEENKYKVKIGFSITDLGYINYKGGKTNSYDLTRDASNPLNKADYDKVKDLEKTEDQVKILFKKTINDNPNILKTSLPRAIHLNADYNINELFYINLDTNLDIASKTTGTNIESTYILSPRIETKWFGAQLPLSISEFSGFNAGLGLRAGPIYLGSGSILSGIIKNNINTVDVYFGFKIPVSHSKPEDLDNDGLFDLEDKCPEKSGPKENKGCPWGDEDKDGVTDNIDKCKTIPGPKENKGCPWGDKDKDGITDNNDKCPNIVGLKTFEGCPDTDKDGTPDNNDKCPNIVGLKAFEGCPDTDKDGTPDSKDKCSKVAGPKENKGCPWGDKDKDGVLDKEDKCPDVPGTIEEAGCPKKTISKAIEKSISSYAKSIYFNSAKTSFKLGVTETLDMIINILNQYPTAKFNIQGHTDSHGKAENNRLLSERRAKTVEDYLVKKGVSAERLTSYGFGEEYPIDNNKTKEGRANNRRVEILLKK